MSNIFLHIVIFGHFLWLNSINTSFVCSKRIIYIFLSLFSNNVLKLPSDKFNYLLL